MSDYMAQKMDDQIEYAQRTYDEMCEEIDHLTRELAERETQLSSIRQLLEDAEARAVPSWTETKFALDAWLKKKGIFDDDSKAVFAAAAWKACWDFVRANCSANASLPDRWVAVPVDPPDDFLRDIAQAIQYPAVYAERAHPAAMETARRAYRAMLSARPEFPPNGLPKELGNEDH